MKTLVAPPDFNEAKHVAAVPDEVLRYAEKVLVVDDGLTDGTSQLLMGTIGRCLVIVALHPTMHYGQVADARRMAGRDRLFG